MTRLAALLILAALPARAGDFWFEIVNDTDLNSVEVIARPDGGDWSASNLIDYALLPGDAVAVAVVDDAGECWYDIGVTFGDGQIWQRRLDLCQESGSTQFVNAPDHE